MLNSRLRRVHAIQSGVSIASPGKWLPALLVALFYFNSWKLPGLYLEGIRWYMLLGFALIVYRLQGKVLNLEASNIFWMVQGLLLMGVILSIFRDPEIANALLATISITVVIVTYLLLIPTIATRRARRFSLIVLLLASVFWTYRIHTIQEEFTVTTFADINADSNHIALCLALSGTALLAFGMLWQPALKDNPRRVFLFRLLAILAACFFVYSVVFTYSISNLATALVGLATVILVVGLKRGGVRGAILFLCLASAAYFLISHLLVTSPIFAGEFERVFRLVGSVSSGEIDIRAHLVRKGLSIIYENPFIGIGQGQTKQVFVTDSAVFGRGLLHNTYLSAWAELGLPGLLSYIAWIVGYIKVVRLAGENLLPLVDRIWLILMVPFFFSLNFIDAGGQSAFLLALMTGIYYDVYQRLQKPLSGEMLPHPHRE